MHYSIGITKDHLLLLLLLLLLPLVSFLGNTLLSKTFASVTVVGEVPLQERSPEGGGTPGREPQGVPEPVLAGYGILDQSRGYA
jgi:hypothetical protein